MRIRTAEQILYLILLSLIVENTTHAYRKNLILFLKMSFYSFHCDHKNRLTYALLFHNKLAHQNTKAN